MQHHKRVPVLYATFTFNAVDLYSGGVLGPNANYNFGFSAATGSYSEAHNIVSSSFCACLVGQPCPLLNTTSVAV